MNVSMDGVTFSTWITYTWQTRSKSRLTFLSFPSSESTYSAGGEKTSRAEKEIACQLLQEEKKLEAGTDLVTDKRRLHLKHYYSHFNSSKQKARHEGKTQNIFLFRGKKKIFRKKNKENFFFLYINISLIFQKNSSWRKCN